MTCRSLPEPFAEFARHSVCGRMIAVVCALSFLIVSFTHTLQHYQTASATPSHELSFSTGDNSSVPAEQAALLVEHCHGCSMIASVLDVTAIAIVETASEPVSTIAVSCRSCSLIAETPPPIALT